MKIENAKFTSYSQTKHLVEEISFGWIVHGRDEYSDDQCMFARETSNSEKLFSSDALAVKDRGDTTIEILNEFKENIVRKDAGRYQIQENLRIPMNNIANNSFST